MRRVERGGVGFVLSHPSLEKSEGWGTRRRRTVFRGDPTGREDAIWMRSQDCVRRGGLHPGLFSRTPYGSGLRGAYVVVPVHGSIRIAAARVLSRRCASYFARGWGAAR